MKYAIKFLWHVSIMVGRVGWILIAGFFTIFGPLLMAIASEDKKSNKHHLNESFDMPDIPHIENTTHNDWALYWGNFDKKH